MKRAISITVVLILLLTPFLVISASRDGPVAREQAVGTRATLYVGPGQTYSSIQSAISAAYYGDTIRVFEGIYYETITISKTVSVIGNGSATTRIIKTSAGGVSIIT